MGKPDLLFLLVVFWAFRLDLVRGAVLTFLTGLLMDTFSGIFLVLYPITYLLVFFSLKIISKHKAIKEPVYQVPLTAIGYLAACSGMFVASTILTPDVQLEWTWGVMLLQALLLSVIAIPFFGFNDFILRIITGKSIGRLVAKPKTVNKFRSL